MDSFIIIDKASPIEVVSEVASILKTRGEKRIRIVNADDSLALKKALVDLRAQSERLTLVSSEIDIDTLKELVSTASFESHQLAVLKSVTDFEGYELGELTLENLIPALSSNLVNAAPYVSVSTEAISELEPTDIISSDELAIIFIIEALSRGDEIVELPSEARIGEFKALTDREICSLILFALSRCNIEELFPNHSWEEFQSESLAYCYHSLATTFIKLGNLEAAKECLNISERYEDSPRLLALRGMIASTEGRELEAVAHLVTSLQQYEARKKENGRHYVNFTPANIEVINTDLKEGLDALNHKDNWKAYEHFTRAIYNFDSFWDEAQPGRK